MPQRRHFSSYLQELATELRRHQLWQLQPPSSEALASQTPFALDTLAPHEWLQWIFIPRMQALLEAEMPLPQGFSVAPYFEEVWKEQRHYHAMIELLRRIDRECA